MSGRKICIIGRVLDQDDGLGVYSYNLLDRMIANDPTSRYIILLKTPKSKDLFSKYDNVEMKVIPAKVKTIWDHVHVPIAARKCKADLIFNPKFSIPIFSRIPSVFVLQASDWYVNPGNYEWWDNVYIRIMIPLYSKKAKKLTAISQCVVDDLVKYTNLNASKVTVSYAAPSDHFKPVNDNSQLNDFAKRYHLPDRFILAVARAYHTGHGRLPQYPGGNVEGLIAGYKKYRSGGGRLPLVIAGTEIEAYLRTRNYSDNDFKSVHFTGFVPHDEIVYLYNLAEFFVLTTLYESFAFPLVEAMACGCPAIVPATGACPEVAEDGAMLVHPLDFDAIGEAMLKLGQSEELRNKMKNAGITRARKFTWEETARLTLKVFDQIVPR